jgi:hypothetical protein
MRWVKYLSHTGSIINAYKMLIGTFGRKRPFGVHRNR